MEDYAFIFMVDLCISHLPPFTDMSQRGKSEENPIMGHSPPSLLMHHGWKIWRKSHYRSHVLFVQHSIKMV